MPGLTLTLFGPPHLAYDGEAVQLRSRKALALLTFLAVTGTTHRRATLTAMFWPESDTERGQNSLRNTLSLLRRALGGEWLLVDRETIGLDGSQEGSVDLLQFRALVAQCGMHDHTVRETCPECLPLLSEAVELYRGDFLAGFTLRDSREFDTWQSLETEALRQELVGALERLLEAFAAQGEVKRASSHAKHWLALDPLDEAAHRGLMRLYAGSGQQTAALRQYSACEQALMQELGVSPSEETRDLYQTIKEGRLPRLQALPSAVPAIQAVPCPRCGSANREDAKFCTKCGAELAAVCPQCGAHLPRDADLSFCLSCGTQVASRPPSVAPVIIPDRLRRLVPRDFAERLLTARREVTRERRVVTILFSDVEGSSSMAERLDPEEVMDIMDGAFDVLIEPITRYEGTLARLMGDRILAFFGAPIAHEDDAERACRAALDIIEGTQAYAARLKEERDISGFRVRVGIHTGLVVVGEVGSDLRAEYTAMGDAVNLASRMEEAAEPGTVLITEDTHRLIGALFDTEALGPIQIRGRREPVAAYQVVGPSDVVGKGRGIAGLESPMVGRRPQFAALQEALTRLQAGIGGIVTIVGEAGIGKSRLVAEVRKVVSADILADRLHWVEGRCLSYGTSTAYLLWLDVLRGALGLSAGQPSLAERSALRGLLEILCPEQLDDVYPYLARVMSLPLETEDEARMRGLEGEGLRVATFRAVEAFVEAAASDAPLALVCEDLHWADPTSVELLEHLLPLTDGVPLLIVCVFRPRTEDSCWRIRETAGRVYRHRHTDLWLEPLSANESEALVVNLLQGEGLPETLRSHILRHGEGNPFYVEEIIRSLIDAGAIVEDEATGLWQATEDVADIPIPDTLHGVLTARIDRLQESTRHMLQMASVIGRVFSHRVLMAIAETQPIAEEVRSHPGRRRGVLDAHLVTLQREEMVHERARMPEREYIFKHHLTQEAAYAGLLRSERRVLHRQVAEVLEELHSERIDEQLELLAHHWKQGEEPAKAINYLLRAGDRARQLGASLEAINYYELALQDRASLKTSRGEIELHSMHERLGDVYLENLSRQSEALEHYEHLLRLAVSAEDKARGARKVAAIHHLRGNLPEAERLYESALAHLRALSPNAEASRVHFALSNLFVHRNELQEAVRHAVASLEISRQIADTRGLADANKALGYIAIQRGDTEAVCKYHEHSLRLYRELGDLPRIAQACNNLGVGCRMLGRTKEALNYINEGLELARRIGDTREEAVLLMTMAELLIDQGEWASAIAHLERALPLAEECGVAPRLIEAHCIIGSAYEGARQLGDAQHHLETAEALAHDTQHLQYMPEIYLNLARVKAGQCEYHRSQRYIALALNAAGPQSSDAFLGLMHRCRGYVYARCGNWDDAVSHLAESLKYLERCGLPVEVGKTRLSLGAAHASRGEEGDRGRAGEHLLAALSTFEQMGAHAYLAQVKAQLTELRCTLRTKQASLSRDMSSGSEPIEKMQGGSYDHRKKETHNGKGH